MAYTTINKSTDYFNTKIYTGNDSTQSITGVGFQPDWVWIKTRSDVNNHTIFDSVRGVTKRLRSNQTNAENTSSGVTSFDSDGFSVGSDSAGNSGTMVSWNWKANGSGSANSDGTISSTVSVDTTSGFSVVKYTGNSSNGATIGHGLGAVPKMIIVKNYDKAEAWQVYHTSLGNTSRLFLNTDAAESTGRQEWYSTTPTSSVFYVGTGDQINLSGDNYIAYCFADIQGYSKFGSYTGNGNVDGSFIYTGFKPAFVMVKRTDSTANWGMFDSGRNPSNVVTKGLIANTTAAEDTSDFMDFTSNGFKHRSSSVNRNGSGNTYIYMAFAEAPLVGSNNVPATAR